MLNNIFEQVKRDAVEEARQGQPQVPSAAANFPGDGDIPRNPVTYPDENGNTIGPFIVDSTPVDDPGSYMM